MAPSCAAAVTCLNLPEPSGPPGRRQAEPSRSARLPLIPLASLGTLPRKGGRDRPGKGPLIHAQRLQLAMQRRALHADEFGGAGDVAAESVDLGDQIFALEHLASLP